MSAFFVLPLEMLNTKEKLHMLPIESESIFCHKSDIVIGLHCGTSKSKVTYIRLAIMIYPVSNSWIKQLQIWFYRILLMNNEDKLIKQPNVMG